MLDVAKFLNESFVSRQATIQVPELKSFFGKNEKPEWTVRGLTAAELGRVNHAADNRQEHLAALAEVVHGSGDKADAILRSLGLSEKDVPQDVSRRIEMLTVGSVSPELGQENRDVAVKLAESFPTVFFNLTTQILSLTGQGAEVGKLKRSGSAATSKQQ